MSRGSQRLSLKKNLRRMVQFAEAFPEEQIVVTLSRQLGSNHFVEIVLLRNSTYLTPHASRQRIYAMLRGLCWMLSPDLSCFRSNVSLVRAGINKEFVSIYGTGRLDRNHADHPDRDSTDHPDRDSDHPGRDE